MPTTHAHNAAMADPQGQIKKRSWWRSTLASPMACFGLSAFLCLSAIVSGWDGIAKWEGHSDAVATWGMEAHHTASEVAETLGAILGEVSDSLQHDLRRSSVDMLNGQTTKVALQSQFRHQIAQQQYVRFVSLFSAEGDLLVSSDATQLRRNVTGRGRIFIRHHRDSANSLYVLAGSLTGPQLELTQPALYLLMTLGIDDANGNLQGVLVAGVTPDSLLNNPFTPAFFLRKDVRLFQSDGRLLAVHQDGADHVGEVFPPIPAFRDAVNSGAPQWGELPNPLNGRLEIAAYHPISGLPLVVSARSTNGPQFHDWWRTMAIELGAAAAAALLSMFLLLRGLYLSSHLTLDPDDTEAHPTGPAE